MIRLNFSSRTVADRSMSTLCPFSMFAQWMKNLRVSLGLNLMRVPRPMSLSVLLLFCNPNGMVGLRGLGLWYTFPRVGRVRSFWVMMCFVSVASCFLVSGVSGLFSGMRRVFAFRPVVVTSFWVLFLVSKWLSAW